VYAFTYLEASFLIFVFLNLTMTLTLYILQALNAYLVALLSNGAALCEKTPVLNLLRAFLSGTKLAWQEVRKRRGQIWKKKKHGRKKTTVHSDIVTLPS
jgi:hypothetical protein